VRGGGGCVVSPKVSVSVTVSLILQLKQQLSGAFNMIIARSMWGGGGGGRTGGAKCYSYTHHTPPHLHKNNQQPKACSRKIWEIFFPIF
jgi:hypothetical protein